jgi:kelch-like protein 19
MLVHSNAVRVKRRMNNSCYFTGVAALNQYIYVVGGYDGSRQLNTVERYDTEKDSWDSVASIRIARSALSVTVLDGKLYAMGKLVLCQ